MPSDHASAELLAGLSSLLVCVREADLRLDVPTAPSARAVRTDITDQLSDYILPRLVQLEAPLLAVVGGSTGAGKSTLVNSLVGEPVTEPGVLRPTTRSPVLAHHPDDAHWFAPNRILPDLERAETNTNDGYGLRLAPTKLMPRGLAILDAPDVDSIDKGNRDLATQLLAAADLWLFVTSAARYADQVPWDYLRQAAERSTSVAVVLDRTSDDAISEVRGHLARMMTSRGLSDSPLFTIPETKLDDDGLLPQYVVASMVGWLHDLAADPKARHMVVNRTLDGAVRHVVMRTHDIADALDEQIAAATELTERIDQVHMQSAEQFARAVQDGTLLQGDVAVRWREFVGTGELLASVEDKVSRIRGRLVEQVRGRRTRSTEIVDAIESAVGSLIVGHAESAAEETIDAWRASHHGRALLAQTPGIEKVPADVRVRAERIAHDWQQAVVEKIRTEGADKRMTARFLAFGVNGVAVALMVSAFAPADSGSAGSLGRKLLDAIFGESTVQAMTRDVRADLIDRASAVFDTERARFAQAVASPAELAGQQAAIREAARHTEYARHVEFLNESENPAS